MYMKDWIMMYLCIHIRGYIANFNYIKEVKRMWYVLDEAWRSL